MLLAGSALLACGSDDDSNATPGPGGGPGHITPPPHGSPTAPPDTPPVVPRELPLVTSQETYGLT